MGLSSSRQVRVYTPNIVHESDNLRRHMRFSPEPRVETRHAESRSMMQAETQRSQQSTHDLRQGSERVKVVIALYNYKATDHTDISFDKGDRMEVINNNEKDVWWSVRHLGTGEEGFIPSNFVAEDKSVESEEWFFGKIGTKEAKGFLMGGEYPRGTFLVRHSEKEPSCFALSLIDAVHVNDRYVKHYKIRRTDSGRFYISSLLTFISLRDLVDEYTRDAHGLCYKLVRACPKPQPLMWDLSPQLRDQWEIDPSNVRLIKRLGRGNFGEVWYGKWNNSTEVAVKTLLTGTMSKEAFLEEAAIMKQFRHDKLVKLYAVCTRNEPMYIVQEYMSKGALLQYLRDNDFTLGDLVYFAAQVANGMQYLEQKNLIHRDLAARNVLVGENQVVKICDFGLARVIVNNEYLAKEGTSFPIKWTAPEGIKYSRFSIKSDVWSYGVLLMEIFTLGQSPYPAMNQQEVYTQVTQGYRMPYPISYPMPRDIYQLIRECWHKNPESRPTFEYLNYYFEEYNITSEILYREI